MLTRILIYCAGLTLVVLILASPALAGGWAVITLDKWPGQVTAGQPLSIGFVVRQHGQRPMAGLTPQVTALNQDTGESLTVIAPAEGQAGHYRADLILPQPGTWHWSIQAFTMDQPMPPLVVAAPAASQQPTAPVPLLWLIGGISLAGLTGTSILWWRTRTGWASGLVLATALAGGLGMALAASQPSMSAAAIQPANPVELGQTLFVAKGCLTCHSHQAVDLAGNLSVNAGPDLSRPAFTPDYLRVWLKDPAAVKPGTSMPNLGLKKTEIEALAAFLTHETTPALFKDAD